MRQRLGAQRGKGKKEWRGTGAPGHIMNGASGREGKDWRAPDTVTRGGVWESEGSETEEGWGSGRVSAAEIALARD